MIKRQITIVIAGLFVVGSIIIGKVLGKRPEPAKTTDTSKKVKLVNIVEVSNKEINAYIPITGKLKAKNRIELFAEVSGIYEGGSQPFKEGNRFTSGTVLIKIDNSEAKNNLIAQRSNLYNQITQAIPDLKMDYPEAFEKWQKYLHDFDIQSNVKSLPATSSEREKYFISARNIYNLYYSIKSLEERLSKYIITAPFNGVVTESFIDPGTLVRVGQKMGEYIDPGLFELETTVSVSDISNVKKNDKVILTSNDIPGSWTGMVSRINDKIDPTTQTVKVFINVQGEELKEGMFLKGKISTDKISSSFAIARNLIRDNESIFVVNDSILGSQKIQIVRFFGDSVIVKGLPEGTKLLGENIPGAYNGMYVKIAGNKK